jgi:hypothetical protein
MCYNNVAKQGAEVMNYTIKQKEEYSDRFILETIKRNISNPAPFYIGKNKLQLYIKGSSYLKLHCSDEDLLYKIYRYVELVAKEYNIVEPYVLETSYIIKYIFSSFDYDEPAMHVCEWHQDPKENENRLLKDVRCENIERIYRQTDKFDIINRNHQKIKKTSNLY